MAQILSNLKQGDRYFDEPHQANILLFITEVYGKFELRPAITTPLAESLAKIAYDISHYEDMAVMVELFACNFNNPQFEALYQDYLVMVAPSENKISKLRFAPVYDEL